MVSYRFISHWCGFSSRVSVYKLFFVIEGGSRYLTSSSSLPITLSVYLGAKTGHLLFVWCGGGGAEIAVYYIWLSVCCYSRLGYLSVRLHKSSQTLEFIKIPNHFPTFQIFIPNHFPTKTTWYPRLFSSKNSQLFNHFLFKMSKLIHWSFLAI